MFKNGVARRRIGWRRALAMGGALAVPAVFIAAECAARAGIAEARQIGMGLWFVGLPVAALGLRRRSDGGTLADQFAVSCTAAVLLPVALLPWAIVDSPRDQSSVLGASVVAAGAAVVGLAFGWMVRGFIAGGGRPPWWPVALAALLGAAAPFVERGLSFSYAIAWMLPLDLLGALWVATAPRPAPPDPPAVGEERSVVVADERASHRDASAAAVDEEGSGADAFASYRDASAAPVEHDLHAALVALGREATTWRPRALHALLPMGAFAALWALATPERLAQLRGVVRSSEAVSSLAALAALAITGAVAALVVGALALEANVRASRLRRRYAPPDATASPEERLAHACDALARARRELASRYDGGSP
jgi:hypothetical protein